MFYTKPSRKFSKVQNFIAYLALSDDPFEKIDRVVALSWIYMSEFIKYRYNLTMNITTVHVKRTLSIRRSLFEKARHTCRFRT